ncbi:hypothetical protein B0H63DRAFT_289105 [Podospora didyma]|uniref:Uncharacterized protein n=1 Tax=Podospora didyma TaxID=330526 RepID=A0AAE0N7C4_9PEZI|nr:hypothetical protein B0H63DRAFT_289105 [Podospora didyma]
MMLHTLFVPLLASLASCSRPPLRAERVVRAPPADFHPSIRTVSDNEPARLERRISKSQTFDFDFGVKDKTLWEGKWNGGPGKGLVPPLPPILIGPVPVQVTPEASFALALKCKECRTYGEIDAVLDTTNGLNIGLTFRKAGAIFDFDATASNGLTVTFTIGIKPGKPLSVAGFNATVGLGLDLVLSFSAATTLNGGFQLCIPDGAQLGFDIDMGFNVTTGKLEADSKIKTIPANTFSLLPLSLSTAASVTAAVVLRAEAGIAADQGLIKGNVGAGASLTLVEVKIGETSSTAPGVCPLNLFIGVDTKAEAHANVIVGTRKPLVKAAVETVFASAGTSICLGTNTRRIAATTAAPPASCATVLETVTRVKSLTSCLVPVVNCPASLTQLVVMTQTETLTSRRCPGVSNATTTASNPTCPTSAFKVPPLSSPIVSPFPSQFLNATTPFNATVTAIPAIITPPPSPSPSSGFPNLPTGGGLVVTAGADSIGKLTGKSVFPFVGFMVLALVLL